MTDLPDFLGIGATKAGTSWLFEMLASHPAICMPVIKEVHYFDALQDEKTRKWTGRYVRRELRDALRRVRSVDDPATKPMRRHIRSLLQDEPFTEGWYRQVFSTPGRDGRVSGDITPAYAELSDASIEAVARLLPGVKLIHVVRHPVERALSHLRMVVALRSHATDEASLLALLDRNRELFTRGAAEQHLPRWLRSHGASRLLVLPFGWIKRSPVTFMRAVEDFLGLPAFDAYPLDLVAHRSQPMPIPDTVVRAIAERVQPTVDFLAGTYGTRFLDDTR
ncbi:MAG TPA: sulfotransferase [Nevskiaceae bacterium]|nr:sulfotransferase [Nevskiaceae bacterium]